GGTGAPERHRGDTCRARARCRARDLSVRVEARCRRQGYGNRRPLPDRWATCEDIFLKNKPPALAGGHGQKPPLRLRPSAHLEILGRGLAVAAGNKFVFDGLAFVEGAEARALNGRDVNEHILVAGRGLDEPVTLRRIEPFDGALLHRRSPKSVMNGTWSAS